MEPATILKLAHLMGLVIGFGGALLADFTVLSQAVLRPVSHAAIRQIHFLSRFVVAGLCLLWLSGAGRAILGIALDARFAANEKFWAKLGIVAVLSVNSLFIHFCAFPRLRRSLGRRLMLDGPRREGVLLAFIGSLSFVSWMMAFVLGAASEFNHRTEAWKFAACHVLLTLLAWCLWIALISAWQARRDARQRRPRSLRPAG